TAGASPLSLHYALPVCSAPAVQGMCVAPVSCEQQGVLVETSRHATDGEDRRGEPAQEGTDPHAYGYGEDPLEPAGADGPRAADPGSSDPDAAAEGPTGPEGAAQPIPGEDPATGLHPA